MPDTTDRQPNGSAAVSMAFLPPVAASATLALATLLQMVLKAVVSVHARRNYAKSLDELFAFSVQR